MHKHPHLLLVKDIRNRYIRTNHSKSNIRLRPIERSEAVGPVEGILPATKLRRDREWTGVHGGNLQAPKLTVMKIGYQSKRHPADRTVLPALERVISHWERTDGEHGAGIRVHGKRITLTQSGRNPFIFSPGTLRPRVTLRVIRGWPCRQPRQPPPNHRLRTLRILVVLAAETLLRYGNGQLFNFGEPSILIVDSMWKDFNLSKFQQVSVLHTNRYRNYWTIEGLVIKMSRVGVCLFSGNRVNTVAFVSFFFVQCISIFSFFFFVREYLLCNCYKDIYDYIYVMKNIISKKRITLYRTIFATSWYSWINYD